MQYGEQVTRSFELRNEGLFDFKFAEDVRGSGVVGRSVVRIAIAGNLDGAGNVTVRVAAWRVIGKPGSRKFDLEKLRGIWKFTAE